MRAETTRRPVHTYSIVATDGEEIGVAVQSHWFSVGSVVPWAEAGVGAVATQSSANPAFGPRGLELLRGGLAPAQALERLLAEDPGRELRQLALIDLRGRTAAHTGSRCVAEAGHETGRGCAVQANIMQSREVWPAMARAFRAHQAPLAERLLAALEAGQERGGDLRGQQSAALLVVASRASGRPWEDRRVELRVEDHPHPLAELRRLLLLLRGYQHMDRGELAVERGDDAEALAEYAQALSLCPGNPEVEFWYAVGLANLGRPEEASRRFAALFARGESWRLLARRVAEAGMLRSPAPDS